MAQAQILLAYGERGFSKKLKDALEKSDHRVAILTEGDPPKARYDTIFQLARDPADVAEGTRLLLNKAKKDRSRLLFVGWRTDTKLYEEAARFAQTLLEEASHKSEAEIAILNLGRIYGPGVDPANSGALGHLITEFAQGNVLTLYGDGEDEDHYLFLEDAMEGLALAPEHTQPGETYALAPSIPVTSEAAAQLLFELGGGRHEIGFHRGLSASAEKGKVAGKPLPEFKIKTSFHDGILAILKTVPPAPSAAPARELPRFRFPSLRLPRLTWKTPRPTRRGLKWAGIALLILSPLLYLAGEAGFSFYQLNRARSAFLSLNFPRAQAATAAASSSLGRLSKLLPAVRSLVEISQAAQEVSEQGTVLTQALENLIKSRRGEEIAPQDPQDFQAAQAAFSAAEQHLTLAWLEAQQIEAGFLRQPTKELQGTLGEGIRVLRVAAAFLGQAEELLGYRGERTYLLLFQNSTELRSTGGFFGSFAQLTLENGGVKKLEFFDSYQFQNAGKVPYHIAVRQLLRADETPLYDTNIHPSFPTAAQEIAALFSQAQGIPVHAVLGTTLIFTQDLLKVTGSLELVEFNRTVDAENLFEVATEEAEKEFFPGTTKKKRLLQALGEGLVERIFAASSSSYPRLARAVWSSLNQRNLLLYFTQGEVAQALAEAGWDGGISAASSDYLGVFDNNYSAKVNDVFVKRSLSYRVYSPDKSGAARGELTVTWNHTGTNSWPSNTYQNLVLILTPKGSKLMGAFLNGADFYGTYPYEEGDKSGFAALFFIPHQATTTFKIIYELPKGFDFTTLENYRLTVQKQPGTTGDPFTFSFEPTIGKEATGSDLQKKGNGLIFEGSLTTDLELKIEIKER